MWDHSNCCYDWLRRLDVWIANREANEAFLFRLLKPIVPVLRQLWRWNRPILVRRLPMWSAHRWRSVT